MKEIVYLLKIDGIEGESTHESHKGAIEVLSWSWGESMSGTSAASGGGAGKVEMQALQAVAQTSKASPKLMLACAKGQHIKEAVLTGARKSKKGKLQEFVIIKLVDVTVASFQVGSEQGSLPTDSFALNFTKIEISFIPVKEDGSLDAPVTGGWDVKTNKPV